MAACLGGGLVFDAVDEPDAADDVGDELMTEVAREWWTQDWWLGSFLAAVDSFVFGGADVAERLVTALPIIE